MAEADKKKGEDDEAAAPATPAKSGGGNKLVLIVGASLAVLIVVCAGAVFMMLKKTEVSNPTEEVAADAAHEGAEEHAPEPVAEEELTEGEKPLGAIYPLESFVVNLSGGRYIRAQVRLEFETRDIPKKFYTRLVPVRDGLISVISSKRADDLLTSEGREGLKRDIRDRVNEVLKKEDVKNVYFTQFVIQ